MIHGWFPFGARSFQWSLETNKKKTPRSDGVVSDYGAGAGMPNFGKPWSFWRFFQWEKTPSTAGNGGNIPHKIPQKIPNKNYESPKIEVFWNWYKWGKYSFLAMFEWRCSFTNCWRLSFLLQFCTMYELGESGFPNSDFVWWLKDWRKTWEWRNTWVVHPQELEFVNIWSFKFPIPHRCNRFWSRLKHQF